MKRLLILVFICTIVPGVFSQAVILNYKTHGLEPGQENPMKMASYVDPGQPGEKQVWDLSGMEAEENFMGTLSSLSEGQQVQQFGEANVLLNENGTRFFFSLEEDALKARGMMTSTGKVLMIYDHPFTKMVYPFAYGDCFSGEYDGRYFLAESSVPLVGEYTVKADGFGKLILPGGREINNTLRVVSTRSYNIMGNTPISNEIISYRWYSASERFPLAVIINTRSSACSNGNTSYKAAYRILSAPKTAENNTPDSEYPNIPDIESPLRIYPNPIANHFTVEYTLSSDYEVLLELYDNTGKKIAILVDLEKEQGTHREIFNADDYFLDPGVYFIRSYIGGSSSSTSFVKHR